MKWTKVDIKMDENLLCDQRKNVEKEMKHLKDLKYRKGKSASIFSLKNKVVGAKKVIKMIKWKQNQQKLGKCV